MFPGSHLATQPDKPALIMAGSGEVQTFAELDAAANRLSHVLRNAGIEAGDHVAICMENNPQFLEVLWGAITPESSHRGLISPYLRRTRIYHQRLRSEKPSLRRCTKPNKPPRSLTKRRT